MLAVFLDVSFSFLLVPEMVDYSSCVVVTGIDWSGSLAAAFSPSKNTQVPLILLALTLQHQPCKYAYPSNSHESMCQVTGKFQTIWATNSQIHRHISFVRLQLLIQGSQNLACMESGASSHPTMTTSLLPMPYKSSNRVARPQLARGLPLPADACERIPLQNIHIYICKE